MMTERLEPEDIDAALQQPLDRLAERDADRVLGEVQDLACRWTERPDRARDEHVATGHVTGLAGELGTAAGQPAGTLGEAVRRQADRGSPRTSPSR